MLQVLPAVVAIAAVLFGVTQATTAASPSIKSQVPKASWMWPAVLSVAFFAFSAYAMQQEGTFGFWTEHIRNLWGNQIFIDLLAAASIAFYLIVPLARAQGMPLLPWFIAIAALGSIALLAMLARLLYLQESSTGSKGAKAARAN